MAAQRLLILCLLDNSLLYRVLYSVLSQLRRRGPRRAPCHHMDMLLTVVSALAHTGDKNERGWFVFAISGLPRCDPLVIRALRPQVPQLAVRRASHRLHLRELRLVLRCGGAAARHQRRCSLERAALHRKLALLLQA